MSPSSESSLNRPLKFQKLKLMVYVVLQTTNLFCVKAGAASFVLVGFGAEDPEASAELSDELEGRLCCPGNTFLLPNSDTAPAGS